MKNNNGAYGMKDVLANMQDIWQNGKELEYMNKVINKFKRKLYFFSLKMMLNDFKNGDLQLTGKQKSQLETLMWKVKYKLIQRQKIGFMFDKRGEDYE